ncbi:MAG TPA: gliding motility protein GldN [Flavitalea sp.]|nr:gliding motility protein GldN [Flavitalea sp.]
MRNRFIKCSFLIAALAMVTIAADAQQKKPNRPSTKRTTTAAPKKKATTKKANTSRNNNAANNAALAAAPKDTVKPIPMEADLKIDVPRKSLRADNAVERNLVKDRQPLAYEHIREDDATYMQRVWREIDVHEKMNLPFVYKAEGDYGNQRFIMILLNAIKNDSIVAFDANVDDRFTTPLPFSKIAEGLIGKPRLEQIQDWQKDPDGSKGIMKDTLITEIFNPDAIERFWIKEDVIFDKESSRMYSRILGIAPLKTINNPDGSFRAVTPIFWVYYPDLRPLLAKHDVYNGRNYGAKMSWEELFESRMFGSRIVKSTINNSNDWFINGYIKDPILALLEGENVKDKIFNYEQDLWSY